MADTFVFANNAGSTLAGAITNIATTLNLAAGGGALFPNPTSGQQFALTLIDAATGLLREIMYCTARSTDTLTVIRGQEGTTALNWSAGDLAQELWTAGQCAAMLQQNQAPSSQSFSGVDSSGSANTITITSTLPAFPATYGRGTQIVAKIANTNTGATTLVDPNSTSIAIKTTAGNDLPAGALTAGEMATFIFDGTYWQLSNPPFINTLSSAFTLYVSTTGSDSNNGLTSGTPFATLQHAWNVLLTYNLNGQTVTIRLADGTYSAGLIATTMPPGAPNLQSIIINGNSGTPANVSISTGSSICISALGPVGFQVQNMKLTSTGPAALLAQNGAYLAFDNLEFGAGGATTAHCNAQFAGTISPVGNYTIAGGAGFHYSAVNGGVITFNNNAATVSVSGTPAFSTAFAAASSTGNINANGAAFSGSATGQRYTVVLNGVIFTNSGGANFFPGSSTGASATGGQYA